MKYADFIKGNEGFQYSVNLQYDLNNFKKVKGYIPTKKSVELLYEYLLNTRIKERDKATVLIGPYGKGKSHLLLILLNILSGLDNEVINELIFKIEKVDKNCGELIRDIQKEKNKYLPVIINSNSIDLNQAFLIALNQSLVKIDAQDILPTTYFHSAVKVIEGWEKYGVAFEKCTQLIKEQCGVTVDNFIKSLRVFNATSYNIFKDVFKEITGGVEFNPLVNTDIVKLYEEVNHILNEKYGYSGLIVVFDEFSKFIEASTVHNTARDLKILQDFAELAGRCDSPQIHFICITHKTINEYISKIPKDKIDGWRGIEGRFKEIYLTTSSDQNYELISNAIFKDTEKFNKFFEDNKEEFGKYNIDSFFLYSSLYNKDEMGRFEEEILKGCFPLSPYTTYALPKISEKVAQNERTLFTFLSKLDNNSLIDVIRNNKGEKELVTIDNLYDYFESLFKKEVFNENIYSLWLKTDTALNYCESDKEKSLIKAVSIIYVINDFKTLNPTLENIRKALGYSKDEITNIVESLKIRNIIMLRSNQTLDFMPISSIDIEGKVASLIETRKKNIDVSGILNTILDFKYILPRKYNDEFKMVRYFNRVFMTSTEVLSYDSTQLLLDNKKGDGVIINLIYEVEEDKEKILSWINEVADSRVGVIVPNSTVDIRDYATRYVVLSELLNDNDFLSGDPVIESQLTVLLEDVTSYIKNYIENVFDIKKDSSALVIKNEQYKNIDNKIISTIISDICYEHFSNSPIINNELINKEVISAPVLKARNQLIANILDGSFKEFQIHGNSLDCTLFRTTLFNKGLLDEELGNSDDIKPILNEMKNFILSSEKEEINFGELYKNLCTNIKGIAARKGIIPIYLAFVIRKYIDEAIIYIDGRNKKEVSLNAEVINNINNEPNKYCLKIEKGTKEKEDYVANLQQLFSNYYKGTATENRYADIVKAMQRWLQSLSKYSRTHEVNIDNFEKVEAFLIKFRASLTKFDINNRQFIFKDLPKIFKVESLEACIDQIRNVKQYLEERDTKLIRKVTEETIKIINSQYKGSVSSAITTWLYSIADEKLAHLYDVTTNSAIELFKATENNDEVLIQKLAYILTSLSLEDWNDDSIKMYTNELERVKTTIEEYEIACSKESTEGLIKIGFINPQGDVEEKTFDKVEISSTGSLLVNNLEEIFDEFGDSIDDNEKRNVLIKMLEKFI